MDMKLFIPPELESAEPEIRRFFDAMLFKLRKNAHKGKWEDVNVGQMLDRLGEERDELVKAINENNSVEVLLEAADVANFCLILANIAILKGQK